MTEPLPEAVRDLLARQLPTMEHVEILLALAGDDARAWSASELAALTHTTAPSVTSRLEELVAGGLAVRAPGAAGDAHRYAPQTPELRSAVESLDEMYRTKPVTLIKAIYARPASPVQSFADAFRVRKPDA